MNKIKKLDVFYDNRLVGTLAEYKKLYAAFAYSEDWLADGFPISPFQLPLQKKVFIPRIDPFDGLFGVFADSLPDGWGRLLVDRLMRQNHLDPHDYGNLSRLAIVGSTGMGALSYHPEISLTNAQNMLDYDKLAESCRRVLLSEYPDDLDMLFSLGGSSGGARPKILTRIDGEEWIVKFPSMNDSPDVGLQEYRYSECARECGIEMTETRLFPSGNCRGYFGTKRFDRCMEDGKEKQIHMLSVSALLKTSHRLPSMDYHTLMKLTLELTKDFSEVEKMFRLMCFNVFAHNRDDHAKNFTFLYDEKQDRWRMSPAYDLTYSSSVGGEHATTVNGNGSNPGLEDILEVGKSIGLKLSSCKSIANQVRECVIKHDSAAFPLHK